MIDGVHERVRVAMHQLPVGSGGAPEDLCHAQRPVLLGEVTDRAVLSFDNGEHGQVA